MPKQQNSADTTELGNNTLAKSAGTLESIKFVEKLDSYLGSAGVPGILAFSKTCRAARSLTAPWRLTIAVVRGAEAAARKIIKSNPTLFLDKPAFVTDLSGKKIEKLTPLQAAICAGDVQMAQMLIKVLRQNSAKLKIDPEAEIQRQFSEIYPEGIDAVEAHQKGQAQAFKASTLSQIFVAINAATNIQVQFELDTPGQYTQSPLNAALHNFRQQFTATSNIDKIFNPFYLLKALEFLEKQYDNFYDTNNDYYGRNKALLFARQIIGYIQRHLPACYLQAFAQGLYRIVENGEELKRCYNVFYKRRWNDDLEHLGYHYLLTNWGLDTMIWMIWGGKHLLSKFIANKKSDLENLRSQIGNGSSSSFCLPTPVRNNARISCCNIC